MTGLVRSFRAFDRERANDVVASPVWQVWRGRSEHWTAALCRNCRNFAGTDRVKAETDLPASRPPASRYGNPMVTPSFPDALAAPLWGTHGGTPAHTRGQMRETTAPNLPNRRKRPRRWRVRGQMRGRSRSNARNDRTKPAKQAKRPRRWHVRGRMRETTAPNLSNGRNDDVVGTFAIK